MRGFAAQMVQTKVNDQITRARWTRIWGAGTAQVPSFVDRLGVSAAPVPEEAIPGMVRAGRAVYMVGAKDQVEQRLKNLGVYDRFPGNSITDERVVSLERAVNI